MYKCYTIIALLSHFFGNGSIDPSKVFTGNFMEAVPTVSMPLVLAGELMENLHVK